MQTDPTDPDQGSAGGGDPAAGSSPPSGDLDAENARLKEENAKLRAERRTDRVKAIVAEHNLSATQALDLASLSDLNAIETKALEFAKATGSTPPPAAPSGDPAPPAPSGEPSNTDALAGMENGGEGAQPAPADLGWKALMDKEVAEATTLSEVAEIQQRYRAQQAAAAQ